VKIVIDASVAVKWVLDEENVEAALALRDEELIAPAFWLLEAASALWRRSRRGEFAVADALDFLSELQRAPVASLSIGPYLSDALQLAIEIAHPVYDCAYLAVALANDTHVVTADLRFAAIAERPALAGRVRLLGA
jgi:predicted nucleic acid-binding protein